jgi:hypothetical protein
MFELLGAVYRASARRTSSLPRSAECPRDPRILAIGRLRHVYSMPWCATGGGMHLHCRESHEPFPFNPCCRSATASQRQLTRLAPPPAPVPCPDAHPMKFSTAKKSTTQHRMYSANAWYGDLSLYSFVSVSCSRRETAVQTGVWMAMEWRQWLRECSKARLHAPTVPRASELRCAS